MKKTSPDAILTKAIRVRLAEEGLNQSDLAEMLGVCDSTVSVKIRNPSRFDVTDLRLLIKSLHISKDVIAAFLGC